MSRSLDEPLLPDTAAKPLLRAFHAQLPLRTGSLLVTIFGDSVVPRGGEIALISLIQLAKPFGLSDRLVRTSVGRLAKDGWLESTRVGRQSYYRLTEQGRLEFETATRRIYGPRDTEHTGTWTVLLMPQMAAGRREALARAFRWRGFGQPMPGVLVFPEDRTEEVRRELEAHGSGAGVLTLRSTLPVAGADGLLARQAWSLGDLGRSYGRFVRLFEPTLRAVQHKLPAAVPCFVVRTLLIHQYRRIHLRDPLLPPALLPASWTGGKAYDLCRMLYRQVFRAAEEFLSAHAANRDGPLPPASLEALRRFGLS